MSLSDRFRWFVNKKSEPPSSNKEKALTPNGPMPPPPPSHTMEELARIIAQERTEGESKQQEMDKELQALRASLEKIEITTKSSREAQNQTLQFLQQDAEREIKFFERKLKEDMTHWEKQLKEREKAIDQAVRQGQAGQLEKKAVQDETETAGQETSVRAETILKEQEAKLLEERQKWQQRLHTIGQEQLAR